VVDLGEGPLLILSKKDEITEGKKAYRASKTSSQAVLM